MSRRLRCCAMGVTGKWFRAAHAPCLERLSAEGRVELTAASSRSPEGREEISGRLGWGRAYADAEEMLDREKPDYVVLCMAARPMGEWTARLLEAGTPFFVEKPTGHDLESAGKIREAAARSGTPHLVAYNRRFNPLLGRLRELAAERGGVSQVSCEFLRHDVSAPRRMLGSALHSVDALRWLLGEVRAFGGVGSRARYFDGKMIAASLHLEFESGVAGSFTFNVRAGRSYERYRLFAENWTATVSLPSPGAIDDRWWLRVEAGNETVESRTLEDLPAGERDLVGAQGYMAEHRHFVECLEAGRQPSPDVAESVASMELAQKLFSAVSPE